jgi:hypothetical protein
MRVLLQCDTGDILTHERSHTLVFARIGEVSAPT